MSLGFPQEVLLSDCVEDRQEASDQKNVQDCLSACGHQLVDRWIDRCVDRQMHRWTDAWVDRCMGGQVDGQMMDRCMGGQMDGQMHGKGRSTNGQMDK